MHEYSKTSSFYSSSNIVNGDGIKQCEETPQKAEDFRRTSLAISLSTIFTLNGHRFLPLLQNILVKD